MQINVMVVDLAFSCSDALVPSLKKKNKMDFVVEKIHDTYLHNFHILHAEIVTGIKISKRDGSGIKNSIYDPYLSYHDNRIAIRQCKSRDARTYFLPVLQMGGKEKRMYTYVIASD